MKLKNIGDIGRRLRHASAKELIIGRFSTLGWMGPFTQVLEFFSASRELCLKCEKISLMDILFTKPSTSSLKIFLTSNANYLNNLNIVRLFGNESLFTGDMLSGLSITNFNLQPSYHKDYFNQFPIRSFEFIKQDYAYCFMCNLDLSNEHLEALVKSWNGYGVCYMTFWDCPNLNLEKLESSLSTYVESEPKENQLHLRKIGKCNYDSLTIFIYGM